MAVEPDRSASLKPMPMPGLIAKPTPSHFALNRIAFQAVERIARSRVWRTVHLTKMTTDGERMVLDHSQRLHTSISRNTSVLQKHPELRYLRWAARVEQDSQRNPSTKLLVDEWYRTNPSPRFLPKQR